LTIEAHNLYIFEKFDEVGPKLNSVIALASKKIQKKGNIMIAFAFRVRILIRI